MSDIRERIEEFNDEFLLDQYYNKQQDYTPDALAIMEEEINNRKLLDTDTCSDGDDNSEELLAKYLEEEFVPFEHGFSQTDIPLAAEILREEQIPFTVADNQSSGTLPIESEIMHTYTFSVPKSLLEKAKETLNRLFDKSGGQFSVKYSSITERLKAFCFHEINLSWNEMTEEVAVQFSYQESTNILALVKRLSAEADTIEQETGKVLFYYDNLKECAGHLSQRDRTAFPKADLLTILEVLQTYCDREDFPQPLEHTSELLLHFFTQ